MLKFRLSKRASNVICLERYTYDNKWETLAAFENEETAMSVIEEIQSGVRDKNGMVVIHQIEVS